MLSKLSQFQVYVVTDESEVASNSHSAIQPPTKQSWCYGYKTPDKHDKLSFFLFIQGLPTFDNEVTRYLDSVDNIRPNNQVDGSTYRFYPGAERDSFDYNNERYGIHKTTLAESIGHLIKGATGAGAGVMTMHEAFMYGGLWTSLSTTIFIGVINTYTMYMLAKSAHLMYFRLRVSKLSYPDLAEVAVATGAWASFRKFSKNIRYTVDICIMLYMWGTCCVYQIMIANTFKQVIEDVSLEAKEWFNDDIRLYILLSTPILLFLCVIRGLKILAPFSMLADMFIAVCVLMVLYYSLQTNQSIYDRPAWKSFDNFLKFCGMCMYCTSGITVCLPIENNMRHPRLFAFVLNWAMGIEIMLISLIGFFGYLGWGEECRSPINVHLPRNVFTSILQALLALMLCLTFVVQFWVAFKIFFYYVGKRFSQGTNAKLERLLRLVFTLLVTCISILVPDLVMVMTFVGLFILGLINFIFPALIDTLIFWSYDEGLLIRWRVLKNCFLILLGFLMCGSALYSVILT